MVRVLMFVVSFGARAVRAMCRRRADLVIENLSLRQQVAALKKERPRPRLDDVDRAFWVALRLSWSGWASRLLIVHPDTVARWHRDRFRRSWAKISQRRQPGRAGSTNRVLLVLAPVAVDREGGRNDGFRPSGSGSVTDTTTYRDLAWRTRCLRRDFSFATARGPVHQLPRTPRLATSNHRKWLSP